ncbi:C6 finger domain-containing protein, variant [Blastomyces dermatitidis ER-3]|uniref:C6 finger domain-containing protein n=1 Tax=Ajellomyces dermatitidis (strain ER-3 / ATCC MYA-2586) TaxID=559297 RepID=A0ABX2VYY3_AJEDR|nr:C6 finger domain-containing protein [Blastomyces dermatitidis ER-3]XP_045282078.1 C6 finger domain-containing protein, variant [Blastomyces dermatitidis ER-3]OAT02350.1 C6 finger domain-containing protein [Blastomyces dermatitidis ER-3]OAT02351.1 C6 finger domain-containing protein, variant [Blastomyces dermatitidis ER-3]
MTFPQIPSSGTIHGVSSQSPDKQLESKMNSYFLPDRHPREGYNVHVHHLHLHVPSTQDAAQSELLPTPQYPHTNSSSSLWYHPHHLHHLHQPQLLHPQVHRSHSLSQMPSLPNDQRKHKRTRSGCFTCRSRRVKCDETRPTCDRCSKGKRECVYPPPPARRTTGSRANPGTAEKHPAIPESGSSDENNDRDSAISKTNNAKRNGSTNEDLSSRPKSPPVSRLKASISRRQRAQSLPRRRGRPPSEAASDIQERDNSPVSDVTSAISESRSSPDDGTEAPALGPLGPSLEAISSLPGASKLTEDVKFFLAYHRHYITFRHYFMRQDAQSFINNDIILLAMQYKPLLYAIVGFSSYIYSIRHPNGKLYTFLQYYHKSVTGLLKSLSTSNVHHDAMMLTILQLATFEEYIGDWVSVTDHHQAAHRMLTELYTPEKINENEFRRYMFLWYTRFDIVSGILAGNEAILSREWYIACELFAVEDEASHPGNINKKFYTLALRNRRVGMDMASLIAKTSRGLITIEEFSRQNQDITARLDKIQDAWSCLVHPDHLITSFPNKVPLGPNDIVDPYVPGRIYDESLWDVNNLLVDIIGARMMHKYQTGLLLQQLDLEELQADALKLCSLIETMERWPDKPKDSILQAQSSFALAVLFIPSDEKHIMWSRRILAKVERLGFIYPSAFRAKMADLWQLPELNHWWLPNEEGYPRIVNEIRDWTSERELKPRDTFREDIRDLKTMFWRMAMGGDDSSHGSSPSNTLTPPTAAGLNPDTSPSESTS